MLNLDEVGKILGVSRYTVKAWAEEGKIKYTLANNELYFTKKDVDDFIKVTNIKYIDPEDICKELEEKRKKYYLENDIMSPSEIENLINKMQK